MKKPNPKKSSAPAAKKMRDLAPKTSPRGGTQDIHFVKLTDKASAKLYSP